MSGTNIKLLCKRCGKAFEADLKVTNEKGRAICTYCNRMSQYEMRELAWAYRQTLAAK